MRAVYVRSPGGPDALELVELSAPEAGPGQVRVKARAIGVGRPDVLIRQGTYKWMPPLPAVPGAELAGEIDALGAGVTQWKLGDRVLVSARELAQRGGCYAEAIVVSADAPYALPTGIAFADAVSLPNLQLALALMRVAGPLAGTVLGDEHKPAVLITGASGGVATMLSQLAQHLGFLTIGTSRTADKQAYAASNGFDHVVVSSMAELPHHVHQLTHGAGVAFAFDHVGSSALMACLQSLASLGTTVSYNAIQGLPDEDVFKLLRSLLGKSLALRCFSMHTYDQDSTLRRGLMSKAIDLMAHGHVKAPVAQLYALDDVRKIHEKLDLGDVTGKIVMQP